MVALLPSFSLLAAFCALASAAPASHLSSRRPQPQTHSHTHHVRSLPNGVAVRSYHPSSTFEVYKRGIDHPLSKRADATVREVGMAFINSKLGDEAVWRSTLNRNASSHVYAFQQINGIPVANSVANVALNAAGKVASYSHNFVTPKKVAAPTPKLKYQDATSAAAKFLDGTATGRDVQLKYYALEDDTLALTQSVELKLKNEHTVRAFVDAETGEVHGLFDFTSNLSYRVSPINSQDPSKDFELLQDPEDLQASPQGWTNVDGQETGQTFGNNAIAFKDDPDTGVGFESAPGVFDFNLNLNADPDTAANLNASRTNAFFVANTAHDILFRYGFNEAAFNFQADNFGKGGVDGDLVLVSVQDASGTDNAQFTTLEDGQPGVMQMFLFTNSDPQKDGALVNSVVSHEYTHGLTNRLTGGGTADCLQTLESVGLGEGWSDAFAEWTEQTSGKIVDYAVGEFLFAGGIRNFPYSTDKAVNPLLFSDVVKLDEVHNIGEVWANTLHNVHAALVDKLGFSADANTNPDATGGNAVFLHLFIDGLALQPCNPTFLDARLSWIQADQNRFNGANECTLWEAFASRGLGPDASEGVDDFNVPQSCGGTGSNTGSSGQGTAAGGNAGTGNGNAGNNTGTGTGNGNGTGRGRGRGRGRRPNRGAGVLETIFGGKAAAKSAKKPKAAKGQ